MIYKDLGTIAYQDAFQLQEQAVTDLLDGGDETLFLLEHHPVYTIGSGGKLANVLDPSLEAVRVNRGGDVTYHGPGQLVGYPIIDLSRRGRDLHRYLRFMEEFLIRLCHGWGVEAFAIPGRTGVWTSGGKIASIGVGVRRWISMHGFCLNVAPDVSAFERINPCGMAGCRITSLSLELGKELPMAQVRDPVPESFHNLLEQHLPHRAA
jgi:lipoyl(octanoyl) transferase